MTQNVSTALTAEFLQLIVIRAASDVQVKVVEVEAVQLILQQQT